MSLLIDFLSKHYLPIILLFNKRIILSVNTITHAYKSISVPRLDNSNTPLTTIKRITRNVLVILHYLAVSNTAEQLETIHKLILLFGFHYLTGNVPRRVVVSLPAKQVNQLDHKLFSSLQPLLSFFQVASCNRNSYSRRSFR